MLYVYLAFVYLLEFWEVEIKSSCVVHSDVIDYGAIAE